MHLNLGFNPVWVAVVSAGLVNPGTVFNVENLIGRHDF